MLLHTLMSYLNELLGTAITILVGFAYKQYKAKIHFNIKKEYVQIAVRLVNQLYSDLKPEDKLNKAFAFVSDMLAKHKIKATPEEIKSFIESEVNFVKGSVVADVKQVEAPVSPTPQPVPVVTPVVEQSKQ